MDIAMTWRPKGHGRFENVNIKSLTTVDVAAGARASAWSVTKCWMEARVSAPRGVAWRGKTQPGAGKVSGSGGLSGGESGGGEERQAAPGGAGGDCQNGLAQQAWCRTEKNSKKNPVTKNVPSEIRAERWGREEGAVARRWDSVSRTRKSASCSVVGTRLTLITLLLIWCWMQ